MLLLTASLALSAVLMTQANDISEGLKNPPLSEVFNLFDVTSDTSCADIKPANARHSFEVNNI